MSDPTAVRPAPEAAGTTPPAGGDDSWWGVCGFLLQRVFIYCVLYALSIGPLYWEWYESQFVGGSAILAAFYLPLMKLAEWCPPLGAWLDWYIRFWIA